MARTWHAAFPLEELAPGDARLVTHRRDRIAVFRLPDGTLHAVDDVCPHEGYPLVTGAVTDCTLTCQWHNFKFDLRDGRCLMGDEDVRAFPVRVVDGRVEVDVTPPERSHQVERWLDSLKAGVHDNAVGRATRDVVRLLDAGVPPERLLGWAAAYDARFAEYGTTHVLPVATDALRMLPRQPGVEAAAAVMQPLELAAMAHARRPQRPVPAPADPGDDPARAFNVLREAVEAERGEEAEALIRGAVARGWWRDVLEPWLVRLASDHFLDFGHELIYAVKVFDLLDACDRRDATDVLGALVFRVVSATREDLLPPWAPWRRLVAELPFADWWPGTRRTEPTGAVQPWLDAVVDGRLVDAVDAVAGALAEGAALMDVVDTLSVAASERMLRFDTRHDADPTLQNDWLDVTHVLTFTNALRHAALRVDHPDVLRLVFQAVRFIQHHQRLDLAPGERHSPSPRPGGTRAVMQAIASGDPRSAVDLVAGCDPSELSVLRPSMEDRVLQDPLSVPIFSAHLLKTSVAAFDEHAAMRHDRRVAPVLAAVRFAASQVQERRLARRVHEAIRLVVHGKVPRTLT